MIAEIIVDIANQQVNRSFDYHIPSHLEDIVKIGYRVYVPFGKTKRVGFVVEIKETTEYKKKLREIIDVLDVFPVITKEFMEIAKYIAEHNFSFYATVFQTMIPGALKIKYKKVARITGNTVSEEVKALFKRNEICIDGMEPSKLRILYQEVKKGNVSLDTKFHKKKNKNEVSFVLLEDTDEVPTSKKGKELVSYLEEMGEPVESEVLIQDCGYSKSVLDTLIKKGIIRVFKKEIWKEEPPILPSKPSPVILNEDQERVYRQVKLDTYQTYLLHGVTGSGKTEIYMRWIEKVISLNKTALMLVPEISLTPQITSLFHQRFSSQIAILHSRLTATERYKEWKKIYNQEVKIVIGARSAIFSPLNNLGIIIIDECHESTYIQQNNPKYHAIEIAKLRAWQKNCPLILGSATPDVCDYYYATNGTYELLSLPKRANGKALPKSIVVDMKEELSSGNRSVFSKTLQKELKDCYQRHEQSILFLNRRGYASFVMCRSCGSVVKCPHCDVSLTYHASRQILKCHTCGYTLPNPSKCYHCGSDKIRFVGSGTEKLMNEVNRLIPEARVLRVDMDTTSKVEDYEKAFYQFKNKEADILVGTQMVTKGLDFENVTLVGVVNADLALSYPMYDASMVAYNLIEQVSGRAGRAHKEGKVIIQTYNPQHYVIECAKNHDYDTFYQYELQKRKFALLPPFSSILEIKVSSKSVQTAHKEAIHIVEQLKSVAKESIVLGPTEDFIFKKKDIFYFLIQVQAVEDCVLEKIRYIYPLYQNNRDVSISITRM